MRREALGTNTFYHIFNKSIAEYKIFTCKDEYLRMEKTIKYYRNKRNLKFSKFIKLNNTDNNGENNLIEGKLVEIIAYCIMPTHIHFILEQITDKGISIFLNNTLNSYTRYFNLRHKRKGPLWETRSKHILIERDDYLLHLTRYIHLNPVTAGLVEKPELWEFSSYREYIGLKNTEKTCNFEEILDINPVSYKEFVESRISDQKELARIKHLLLEEK